MSRSMMKRQFTLLASLAVLLVGFLGCSVDTPTAPDQVAAPPPSSGGNNWNISVSVNPDVLAVGETGENAVLEPAIVTVKVRSRSDGSNPANGTSMTVATDLGELGTQGSGTTSIGVVLDRGEATVFLYPGNVAAMGEITARLQGSQGRDTFEVIGALNTFITSVTPNSGSESGGTRVTVNGTGFREPLRVRFGTFYGTVTSVSETAIEVTTPASSVPLQSVSCGDGGTEYQPTPVAVTVEFGDGATAATLANGFFYTPDNTGCIGGG